MKWFKKSSPLKIGNSRPAPSPKVLLVSEYISEKSVLFFCSQTSREEILFKLVSSLSVPEHSLVLNAVLEREKMGGTIVDSSISIPHARLKGLKTIELAIGLWSEAPKDQPRLFFLFLSPKEDTKIHLLFLSSLSALFQTENFVEELLRLETPQEVAQKIRGIEKSI